MELVKHVILRLNGNKDVIIAKNSNRNKTTDTGKEKAVKTKENISGLTKKATEDTSQEKTKKIEEVFILNDDEGKEVPRTSDKTSVNIKKLNNIAEETSLENNNALTVKSDEFVVNNSNKTGSFTNQTKCTTSSNRLVHSLTDLACSTIINTKKSHTNITGNSTVNPLHTIIDFSKLSRAKSTIVERENCHVISDESSKDALYNGLNTDKSKDVSKILNVSSMRKEFDENVALETENTNNDDKHDNSADNLVSTLDPQEWLDLDQFEKIVNELKNSNSADIADIEECIVSYTVQKQRKFDDQDCFAKDNNDRESLSKESKNLNKDAENSVISISSDEDVDMKLSISLEDLETVSLSSIEALCKDDLDNPPGLTTTDDKLMKETGEIILEDNNNYIIINNPPQIKVKDTKAISENISNYKNRMSQKFIVKDSLRKVAEKKKEITDRTNETLKKDIIEAKRSLKEQDIDTISITDSNEDNVSLSSYHSSDFEFITEEEANSDGHIINFSEKTHKPQDNDTCKTIEVTTDSGFDCSMNSSQNSDISPVDAPGPSRPSVVPENSSQRPIFVQNYNYRQNHNIPQGEQFYNLFQGHLPTTPYMFEDKSMTFVRGQTYQGMGFVGDRRLRQGAGAEDDEQYKKEAEESAKRILNMYPGENRKRRRRF